MTEEEVVRNHAGADEAEADLNGTGDHDREQERLESPEGADRGEDDRRQAGGWSTHHQLGPGEWGHDQAAEDAGDDAGEERGA